MQSIAEDKVVSLNLERKNKEMRKKVKNIEVILGSGEKKLGWMKDIEEKIANVCSRIGENELANETKLKSIDIKLDKKETMLNWKQFLKEH